MKCENCGKNEVSFYYKSNVNGKITEKHLCRDCAEKLGLLECVSPQSLFGNGLLSLFAPRPLAVGRAGMDDFFANPFAQMDSLFGSFFALPEQREKTEEQPAERDNLLSPEAEAALSKERAENALREELRAAIETENYERAAEIRDQLRGKKEG